MAGVGVDIGLLELDFGEADVVEQHVCVQLLEGLQEVVVLKEGLQLCVGALPGGEVGFYLGEAVEEGFLVVAHFLGGRTAEHTVVGGDGA